LPERRRFGRTLAVQITYLYMESWVATTALESAINPLKIVLITISAGT
jgi:hypothetical protein